MPNEVLEVDEKDEVFEDAQDGVDEAALEAKVGEGLSKTFTDDAEPSEEPEAEVPATEDKPDEGEAKVEEEVVTEAKEDEENENGKQEAADQSAPTLPDSYRRSLKAYGWQDAEIDKNLKLLGSDFISTAAKIHGNRNDEVSRWAAAGRAARERQVSPVDQNAGQVHQHTGIQALAPVDAGKLKEKYGEDELVDAIVGPVNATVAAINAILPRLEQSQVAAQQSEMQALERQINEFFGSASIKPFVSFYGDGKAELKPEQLDHRNKVLETADALLYGAKAQGRNLTTVEALTAAHDLVSGEFKVETVRNEIKVEAKKRSQGLTQKPNSRGRQPDGRKPRTMKELESKIGRKLATVFGG